MPKKGKSLGRKRKGTDKNHARVARARNEATQNSFSSPPSIPLEEPTLAQGTHFDSNSAGFGRAERKKDYNQTFDRAQVKEELRAGYAATSAGIQRAQRDTAQVRKLLEKQPEANQREIAARLSKHAATAPVFALPPPPDGDQRLLPSPGVRARRVPRVQREDAEEDAG
jgi:hypothetical protein